MMNSKKLEKDSLKITPDIVRQFGRNDLQFFCRYYLANYFSSPLAPFHKDWVNLFNSTDNIAIAVPRGHGKSTFWSFATVLHSILYKKKKFILLISDTHSQSVSLLAGIVDELENNPRILRDFGNITGLAPTSSIEKRKWTATDIITTTGIRVLSLSWMSKMRGIKHGANRPDYILCDDLENDEAVHSFEQRKKLKEHFYKSILNVGSPDCKTVVVGTILHFDSLLKNLIDTPPYSWKSFTLKAIENNQPIWPDVWPLERLENKKLEIGSLPFEQEFMNNPISPGNQIIKPVAFYKNLDPMVQYEYYGFIDLAVSEKESADFTAICVLAREVSTGDIYVVEPLKLKDTILNIVGLVLDLHLKYNFVTFGLEETAFEQVFRQVLVAESSRRNIYIPVKGFKIDKDKVRRAIDVTPHIEQGVVKFNEYHIDFMNEIIQFPKGQHDDMVDSLIGCLKMIVEGSGFSVYTVE